MRIDESPTVFATYRVRAGSEEEMLALIEKHWPALHGVGLVTDEPARLYRTTDASGRTTFVEVFTWKEEGSAHAAHETPAVQAIWGPMAELVEERDGKPQWEFPHLQRVRLAP